MNIPADRAERVCQALETGASIADAAAIAKLTENQLEAALKEGVGDADSGRDTPPAAFYLEAKAAAARYRVDIRQRAVAEADAGRVSAAAFIRLLEAAQREESSTRPGADDDVRANLVPIDRQDVRDAYRALLRLVADSGPVAA